MTRPSFTGDVDISAELYALLHARTTSAGASVDAVAEQLINAALDEVGAPWPIHPNRHPVGYAAEAMTSARLATLRAMTSAIAEGLGVRPAKKRDRSGYNGYVIVDAPVFEALARHCAKAGTSMRGTLDREITAELDRLGVPA